jgi:ferritin-like protein
MVIFQKQPAFGFIPVLQINGMKNEEIQTQIQSTEIERRERKAYLPQTQKIQNFQVQHPKQLQLFHFNLRS